MIRTICVFAFLALTVVFVLPFFIVWSFLTRDPNAMYALSMKACAVANRIAGIRVRVEGAENIPAGACVFTPNHVSNIDPLVFFPHTPRRLSVLLKKELMRIPILSTGMLQVKFVFVDRADRESAAASVDLAVRYMREGLSFVVFPEGTRSPDGRLGKFKKGAAIMAIQAGVPVVPVSIAGTQHLMHKGSRWIYPGEATVRFGQPILASEYSVDRRAELLVRLESAVASGLPPDQRPLPDQP